MLRYGTILFVFLSVLVVSGCGYDHGRDLGLLVQAVSPTGAHPVTACSGSSGLIENPSYGCTYLVRGNGGAVTESLARALRQEGFAVGCSAPGSLAALRGDVRVTAEVTQYGSIVASGGVVNVFGAGYRPEDSQAIRRGFVALRLDASRQSTASAALWQAQVEDGGRCDRPLVPPDPIEQCLTWWNGPVGQATSAAAVRGRLGPEAQVKRRERPGVSTCTYTLRAPKGIRVMTAIFDHGSWSWPPFDKVELVRTFRPNAILAASGRLSAT